MKDSGKRIIGITGAFGSGKSTASNFFQKKGYTSVYLSSFLEDTAVKRGLKITRKNLQDLGNEVRAKHGTGYLLKKALEKLKSEEKIVIDGLRNLGEVEELKKNENAVLLAIVADRKVRFERLKNLKRREKLTEKNFYQLDLRDLGINEKITGLQTAFCIALADHYIDSNGSMDEFESELNNFLEINE